MMGVDLLRDGILRFPEDRQGPLNPALEAWAEEAMAQGQDLAEPEAARRAEGVCRICQERAAGLLCHRCERAVCRQDAWMMLGLCRECATEEEVVAARDRRPQVPKDLGIKWVED